MMAMTTMSLIGAVGASAIPTVNLGKDVHGVDVAMPLVGAGTWQYNDTISYESVCKAFEAGYTMLDTANGYGNEKGVGQAIRDCWKGKREELFVMTKIPGGLNTTETMAAHKENMDLLGLEYVDHLMTHFPGDWDVTPERSNAQRRQEEWKALESIYKSGAARSIGLSHYCSNHIDDVLAVATVRPSINQVEYHIGSADIDNVIQKCEEEKIFFMSYSPLCGPCEYKPEDSLVNGKLVTSIGEKYNVSGSQVSLRYVVQQALDGRYFGGVIPKSNNAKHIATNMDIFGFKLSKDDMKALAAATEPKPTLGDCDVTVVV